ncbi:MAG: hypothetical protein LQ350_007912 [Teloschistes chrysophthalmus]|nr:MAG: hypothetical protein LQ350_007912 [Niorma chrysophthalma]
MADENDPNQLEEKPQESTSSWPSETGTSTTTIKGEAGSQTILQKGNSLTQSFKSNGSDPHLENLPPATSNAQPTTIRARATKANLHTQRGFPQLACFLDSDDAFMVYRRFGSVFSRLLLTKQDEIRRMESTLEAMDRADKRVIGIEFLKSTVEDERRGELPEGWTEGRGTLMARLEKKVLEYSELLLKARQLKAMDRPSNRDYNSVLHYLEANGGQLYEAEMDYIYEKEDLVTLCPSPGWLDVLESRAKPSSKELHYYSRQRISTFTTLLIILAVLDLLIVSIWPLYKLCLAGSIITSPEAIGLMLLFTLLFSVDILTLAMVAAFAA